MGFLKDSAKVFTGITVRRALSVLMIPVIAHLLGPKDYGIFQVAMSICTMVSIVGGFAFEASIAVADSKDNAVLRTVGTSIVGILSSALFWVLSYSSREYLMAYFSPSIAKAMLFMLPVVVPLTIINTSVQNYLGYLGKFGTYAVGDIASLLSNYTGLLLFYFLFWKDYRALIAGGVIALVVRLSIYVHASSIGQLSIATIRIGDIFNELWKVRNFAKFNLPSNILSTANVQAPTALIGLAFQEDVVGLFTMARSIITIPTALSGKALGLVFYPKAAEEYRKGRGLGKITWQTFEHGCRLTLFPAIFTAAAAGFILPTLLGHKWNGVAPYVVLLLPMVLLNAVQTQIGIGFIFSILNQQYKILIGNVLLFTCRILPLILCLLVAASAHLTVLAYSIGGATGYSILLAWIFVTVSISATKAFYTWARYCFVSGLCILPILLAILNGRSLLLFLYLSTSILLYGFVFWFKFLNWEQRSLIVSHVYGKFSTLKNKRETAN